MLKIKISACLLIATYLFSYGQFNDFSYSRELKGITGQWHKIILPDDIFGKISPDLNDLRIIGVTPTNDTVEAPYVIRLTSGTELEKEIRFRLHNISNNNNGFYFTFEIPVIEPINKVKLVFKQQNFDWLVDLEGSQNQQDWYTITNNYRILSIHNSMTTYQFTTLTIPDSKYRYFRLHVNSKEKPLLKHAEIIHHTPSTGIFRNYEVRKIHTAENKELKETEIDIELREPVPVSFLKIIVRDTVDYYRPLQIQYLTDSVKTEQGSHLIYNTLGSGTLNSMEKNEFSFTSTIIKQIRLIISNYDNQPLTIDSIYVKGFEHELLARFTKQADYFLIYGNKKAMMPNYDLDQFSNKIPESMNALNLGVELRIKKPDAGLNPLFMNKAWLWTIMVVIILVLGWFSIKMIRK